MKIMKEIDKIDIVPLSKKDILYRLLSDVKKKPKVYRSSKKKISLFSPVDNTKPEIDVPKPKDSQEFSTISNIFDTKYICQPIEKTNTILVYDVINKTLFTQKFESNLFISEIPSFCAWLNYKNNLYISGGEINGKISKNLLKYDPSKNKFEVFQSIPDTKENHSMCIDENDNLYLIGGLNNSVLKYNISSQKWTIFKNKLVAQRNHPICLVKDNDLFVFFGSDIYGGYVNSYEKTNCGGKNNFILYNTEKKINLEFASTIETVENCIIFFGGRNEHGPLKTSLKFNLNSQRFEDSPYQLNESSSFHQSCLPQIGENCFGYFSLENNTFVKINFKYQ
jgi:hypothetical protein